ncbi:MAG: hypothetical protein VXY99_09695, partial [Pseudomonadota bacterium]|nr:hypothetical protein [Pseudomonadota bacterium]
GTPKFLLDWKGYEFAVAAEKQKWPKMYLHKLEETRTAISDTRAAESSQLFSMQMIDTRKLVWRANIDFSDVKEDKEQLKEHLKETLSQSFISPFGKTDAQASVKLSLPFSYSLPSDEIEKAMSKDEISLTLATDAQLFHKLPSPDQYHSMGSWTQAYQSVFDQLSPGTFQIIRQFCREKLIGGKFLSERFDKLSTTYTPRLLTEAGSVFVLKILDKEKAKTALSEWLKSGIPLIEHNDNWKKSPYRNFNGYGEIILNLQLPK